MNAAAIGPAAGGTVGRGEHCPGGVDFPELGQGGLDACFRRAGGCGGALLPVWLCAIDVDGVGGGVIGHTEIYRPADVPELNVIVSPDVVGGHADPLAVHIDGLGAGSGSDSGGCLGDGWGR